jgi:hypothetical protein
MAVTASLEATLARRMAIRVGNAPSFRHDAASRQVKSWATTRLPRAKEDLAGRNSMSVTARDMVLLHTVERVGRHYLNLKFDVASYYRIDIGVRIRHFGEGQL